MAVALLACGASVARALSEAPTAPRTAIVCSMPQLKRTKYVKPIYPAAAVDAGQSGKVVIDMVVNKAGLPADLKVKKSAGRDLDEAALEAVSHWEYQPWRIEGKAQEVAVTVTVRFLLPRAQPPTQGAEQKR